MEGNPDTYTIETVAFTLKNPTKSGYTFTGWSGTGLDGENNMTVTIPKGSTATAAIRHTGATMAVAAAATATTPSRQLPGLAALSPPPAASRP